MNNIINRLFNKKILLIVVTILVFIIVGLLIYTMYLSHEKDRIKNKIVDNGSNEKSNLPNNIHVVKINLNGADSIDEESIACNAYDKSECEVHLPKAYLSSGKILGYSENYKKHEADYLENTNITIDKDIELFVISEKQLTLNVDGSTVDYLSNNNLSCTMYNNTPCEITLPIFNKVGYDNLGYTTIKNSNVTEYYPMDTFYLKENITIYPVWNNYFNYEKNNIAKSEYIDNRFFIETEKGSDNIVKNVLSKLENIKNKMPFLYNTINNNLKIVGISHDTIKRISPDKAIGGVTLKHGRLSTIYMAMNDNRSFVHELSHHWDNYYKQLKNSYMSDNEKLVEMRRKYYEEYWNCIRNLSNSNGNGAIVLEGDEALEQLKEQEKCAPILSSYALSNPKEFFAEAVAYYYLKFIENDSSVKNIVYPNELKDIIERYICIANNNYNESKCN